MFLVEILLEKIATTVGHFCCQIVKKESMKKIVLDGNEVIECYGLSPG